MKDCPPPKPECPSRCAQLDITRGPRREITPNAGPCVNNGVDLYVTADFIYWTAREDNLGYVVSTGQVNNGASSATARGGVHHPDWKFRPGFKVALGMNFEHDGWDSKIEYTWNRWRRISDSTTPSGTKLLLDTLIAVNDDPFSISPVTRASARWRFNLNVLDWELGRNYYISRYLMLRPHFGFKGTWGRQRFNTTFNGLTGADAHVKTSRWRMPYWGIGIRAGLDTAWHFTKSFSLFGEIAFTGLWEQFKPRRHDVDQNIVTGLFTSLFNVDYEFHTIKPIIEWIIGLRWETWFSDDNYHFGIEAGWEEQWWGGQNQFFRLTTESDWGDLVMQGLTVKVRFDF
ncbi:MAG: Lpg1974 family pore-forming outer membrane protein [Chlamydiae bacterium]|nr:Lpg1974 family pore-forming outer membrane protein [Chlamydiota bacterium]